MRERISLSLGRNYGHDVQFITTMRFTVDFQIPSAYTHNLLKYALRMKPLLNTHNILSHLFTRNEAFYFIFLWASINRHCQDLPSQFYPPPPHHTCTERECWMHDYGVQQWESWWWEVQYYGEREKDGNKTIYGLHTALVKHENEFYIRCLFLRGAITGLELKARFYVMYMAIFAIVRALSNSQMYMRVREDFFSRSPWFEWIKNYCGEMKQGVET